MGRHQRAETSGLISFLICAVVGAVSMNLYMEYAPAIWQLTQRRFMVCSGIVAACGVISFIIGYARKSRSLNLKHGWFAPIRRIFEIVALSVVYASTIFLSSFALIGAANDMMGNAIFSGYISSVCAAFAGVVGYKMCIRDRCSTRRAWRVCGPGTSPPGRCRRTSGSCTAQAASIRCRTPGWRAGHPALQGIRCV